MGYVGYPKDIPVWVSDGLGISFLKKSIPGKSNHYLSLASRTPDRRFRAFTCTSSTSIDELGLQAVQEKLYALTKANMQGYKNWDAADSERGFQCASSRASGPSALVLLDRAGSQDVVAFAMWCVVDELHAWEKQLMPQGITVTHPPFLPHIPFSPHPAPHTPVSGACVVLLLC